MSVVRHALKTGAPMFTCQFSDDKATDVNKDLFVLGIPSYTRKTVGKYLESLGATVDGPPPFPPKAAAPTIIREAPRGTYRYAEACGAAKRRAVSR
jgi:hypothetical protein